MGTLRLLRCADCGKLSVPPRERCAGCLSAQLDACDLPGEGTVVAATVIRRPPLALRDRGPYLVAMVRTDAGPFVTGRIEGTDDLPAPGTRVRLNRYDGESPVFERT